MGIVGTVRLLLFNRWSGIVLAGAWGILSGQELSLGGGTNRGLELGERSYAWQLGYEHQVDALPVIVALAWLNEGHLVDHHRDGFTAQGLLVLNGSSRLKICLGGGVYQSFDTVGKPSGGFVIRHPTQGILTLLLQIPLGQEETWFAQTQVSQVFAGEAPHTRIILLGLGYNLGKRDGEGVPTGSSQPPDESCQTVSLLAGRSILNSTESELSSAYMVEYRRKVWPFLDLGASYTDEGELRGLHRTGLAVQGFLSSTHLGGALVTSFGAGPYLSRLQQDPSRAMEARLSSRITLTGAWRFLGTPWQSRLAWHRILSNRDRDRDLIMAGVAYSW